MSQNHVVDVSQSTFERDVIQRSTAELVVVDFWAPWCGPCRMLGPVLERLARQPDSGFVLAKVNTDQNAALAGRYNVRGIPAVKAFRNGLVVDEVVGAQPEPVVRDFIRKNAGPRSKVDPAPDIEVSPADPPTRLRRARELLVRGAGCAALEQLGDMPGEAATLRPLADYLCRGARGEMLSTVAAAAEAHRATVDAWNRKEPSAALYSLLVALNQETGAEQARTRSLMAAIFSLLGEENTVTRQYKAYV